MPYALQRARRMPNVRRGFRGLGCISVTDLTSKCGGYSGSCDPRDSSCVANAQAVNAWAQDIMYASGWPNTCIPDDTACPNLSSGQQQQIAAAFANNTPIDLSTGQMVNPNAPQGSGVVPGVNAPIFTAPLAPPKPPATPATVPTPASSAPVSSSTSPATALQAAQASASSVSTDWLTQSMLGGIPNWGLVAGGVAGLFLVMSMGGKH
jgi:hypothetical protein